VGPLVVTGGQHVQQRPQRMRERLGRVLSDLVTQQYAQAVLVLSSRLVCEALHFREHGLLAVHGALQRWVVGSGLIEVRVDLVLVRKYSSGKVWRGGCVLQDKMRRGLASDDKV
jgi:hypothetical protein